MDIIHLLPDTVANQIAAGEVIQRPSSVVKELVENAVDAGATLVEIVVEEAGKSLIQVIDNGCGMSVTDARLAFERHATSKIRQADDLFALRTMGFRGEALPSIAAVAQVELRTRTNDDDLGVCLRIEGGKVRDQQRVTTPRGANFAVRNLFFNIPARRKFLKSNLTEMGAILTEFERLALAHPQVAFRLHRDGTLLHDLPAGTFRQRIAGLFGHRMDKQLVPVATETTAARISGFTGVPESARKGKRAHQFFFANNRYMRHPYFARAVQTVYERLVPEGEQVPFFLRFDVDPATVDVNIHPTKTEIKFQDEPSLWQILQAAVREALGKYGGVPTIDFDTAGMPDIPLFVHSGGSTRATAAPPPHIETDPAYNPFGAAPDDTPDDAYNEPHPFSSQQQENGAGSLQPSVASPDTAPRLFDEAPAVSAQCLQYHGRYIVTSVGSGLMLIDQHRAHQRVLYDRFLRNLQRHKSQSQGLLFPQTLALSPADAAALDELRPALADLGFDLSPAESDGTCQLRGVPAGTEGLDPERLLLGVLNEARSGNEAAADTVSHRLALALAHRAALPVGQELTEAEMSALVGELFTGTTPAYAPDGTPAFLLLADEQISRFFD